MVFFIFLFPFPFLGVFHLVFRFSPLSKKAHEGGGHCQGSNLSGTLTGAVAQRQSNRLLICGSGYRNSLAPFRKPNSYTTMRSMVHSMTRQ